MDRYALTWNHLYIKDAIKGEDCPEMQQIVDNIELKNREKGKESCLLEGCFF